MTIHHAPLERRGAIGLTAGVVAVALAFRLLAISSKLAALVFPAACEWLSNGVDR